MPKPIISSIETKDDGLKFNGKQYGQYFSWSDEKSIAVRSTTDKTEFYKLTAPANHKCAIEP